MGTLDSQNRVTGALSDVRTSVAALEANDPASFKRRVAIDLRVALFSLDEYASAVPFIKCHDRDRKVLVSARSYVIANADPQIFNGLQR
jgi:hypothetical protein